jgi:aerobic-type carbon monoxide dehydrogenase small subunit (CoxS/CutS family)
MLLFGPEDGAPITVDAKSERPLLDVLRGELGVRSATYGCRDGSCGACRVIVDGALVSSCRLLWQDVRDGARVEAYEAIAEDPAAVRAVDAFAAERPTRCRMCVGALGVTAVSIARKRAQQQQQQQPENGSGGDPLEEALVGAACLCTGRGSWRRALSK